jgi:uncharacterized protein (TIGR02145 family)/prepilin-type N-terminal cleavage/methylation domain-containing protein
MTKIQNNNKQFHGFTIIELLVVIVIIGILAAITYVSYVGIQAKARDTSVLSDLDALDALETNYGLKNNVAGKAWNSGSGVDSDLQFTQSSGNVINVAINSSDYCIRGYNPNGTKNSLVNSFTKESSSGACSIIAADVVIGTQTWAGANLNVGTMITSVTEQTNNSILEKYCFDNNEANCTAYGGLYQWNEMMQYVTTEGAQGICPTGYHIPTDAQWTTLTTYLGGESVAGTALKIGGSSGLNIPLAGNRGTDGSFNPLSSGATLWSSSESSTSAWNRYLPSGNASVYRDLRAKAHGFSVRCLKN